MIDVSDLAPEPPRAYVQARGALDDRAEGEAVAAQFDEGAQLKSGADEMASAATPATPSGAPLRQPESPPAVAMEAQVKSGADEAASVATPVTASGVPPRQVASPPAMAMEAQLVSGAVEPASATTLLLPGAVPDIAGSMAEAPTEAEEAPPGASEDPASLGVVAPVTEVHVPEESDASDDKHLWPPLPESGYYEIGDKYSALELAEPAHDPLRWREAFVAAGDGTADPDMRKIRALRALVWLQTEKAIKCALRDPPLLSYPLARPAPTTRLFHGAAHGGSESEATSAVEVWNMDVLEAAGKLHVDEGQRAVAVLNMANAFAPGGGFRQGAGAQEENLHRRTDAYRFTEQQAAVLYPMQGDVCYMSKDVTVLRGSEKQGYPFFPVERMFHICLLSCAAIKYPRLTSDRKYADEREFKLMETKIASILGAVAEAGCEAVVLSAFGCGAFANPPEVVAEIFANQLRCWPIRRVVFSILDDHNSRKFHNPRGNCVPFKEAFGLT